MPSWTPNAGRRRGPVCRAGASPWPVATRGFIRPRVPEDGTSSGSPRPGCSIRGAAAPALFSPGRRSAVRAAEFGSIRAGARGDSERDAPAAPRRRAGIPHGPGRASRAFSAEHRFTAAALSASPRAARWIDPRSRSGTDCWAIPRMPRPSSSRSPGPGSRRSTIAGSRLRERPASRLLDGRAVEPAISIRVSKGSHLSLGPVREGVRSYLCIAGGFSVSAAPGFPARISEGEILLRDGWGTASPASSISMSGDQVRQTSPAFAARIPDRKLSRGGAHRARAAGGSI